MEKERYPSNGIKIGFLLVLVVIFLFTIIGSCSNSSNKPTNTTQPSTVAAPAAPATQAPVIQASTENTDSAASTDSSDDQSTSSDEKVTFDDATKLFFNMGATITQSTSNNLTTLNITVNQDDLISNVPDLQKDGILNPDITQTGMNTAPYMISTFILQYIAVGMLDYYYQDTNTNNLKVNEYLSIADDYGNVKPRLAISFEFNKRISNKIDWDNFKQENLPKIAPNFKMEGWLLEKLYSEGTGQ